MALAMRNPQPDLKSTHLLPRAKSRWLEVVSHLDPKYGGMSTAVPELGEALAREGRCTIELAAFCTPGEEFRPADLGESTLSYWPAARGTWLHNQPLRARFDELVRRSDGLHLHGLWEQSTAIASNLARDAGKPYVLSAHGMLERWALRKKRLKKLVYSALIERATVRGAACLHALTRAEADDYLRFGARGPIAVIPNGVALPPVKDARRFLTKFPQLADQRILLFLGRLHPKKGVDLLLEAWADIAPEHPDAHLVFAGPDVDRTRASLEQTIAKRGIARVTFTGMLRDELKWSALAAAEAFTLPSHSEGLSMGVLEAMGMALPVIVTGQCNMPEVAEHAAGWEIQPQVASIAAALRELLRNAPATNSAIGQRGARLIEQHYNWSSVAERMADVYRWVEGGPAPTSVELIYRKAR